MFGGFFDRRGVVTGLDIGTSKVSAVVVEVGGDGAPQVVGLGQARSRGVRKGEIVDSDLTMEDVRLALSEAEQMADVEIRSVYLGVSGGHVGGFVSRGAHPVVSADRDITEEDLRDVVRNARAVSLPQGHHVIHVVRQHFCVDGQGGVQNPVGLLGARLEVDLHVVHGELNRLENSVRVVRGLRVEVEDVVFTGLAGVLGVLSSEQKEMGTLVLDFGGGTLEYAVCCHGLVRHTGVLPVGGDHISNDIAYGLKVPLGRAEELKIGYGSAVGGVGLREGRGGVGLGGRVSAPRGKVCLERLGRVMSLRVSETLELVEGALEEAGCLDWVRSGVVVVGGGARMRGLLGLVEHVFGVPASVGRVCGVSGPGSVLEQPEFAAGVGLAKFGVFDRERRRERGVVGGGLGRVFRGLLSVGRV